MTIKHLPGKHNQKLHSSKSKRTVRDYLKEKKKYIPSTGTLGRKVVLPGPDLNLPEGDEPALTYVRNVLQDKYAHDPIPDMLDNNSILVARGFEASIAPPAWYNSDIVRTEISNVTDPEQAEQYAHDFIETSRKGRFVDAVFAGIPIELAEKLNGTYIMNSYELTNLAVGALIYLEEEHNISMPKEFVYTDLDEDRRNVDADKVSVWLPTTGLGYIPDPSTGDVAVPVSDFHNVRHPNHPELPLFTEYINAELTSAVVSTQSIHVDLRKYGPTP